jgi:hypothetical protein
LPGLLGPLTIAAQRGPHLVDLALLFHASEVRSGSGGSSLAITAHRRRSPGSGEGA